MSVRHLSGSHSAQARRGTEGMSQSCPWAGEPVTSMKVSTSETFLEPSVWTVTQVSQMYFTAYLKQSMTVGLLLFGWMGWFSLSVSWNEALPLWAPLPGEISHSTGSYYGDTVIVKHFWTTQNDSLQQRCKSTRPREVLPRARLLPKTMINPL